MWLAIPVPSSMKKAMLLILIRAVVVQEDTAAGGVGRTDEGGDEFVEDQEDEVDPLDAFMNENDAKATTLIRQAEETAKAVDEEEEIDPLDAYMATEVLPAVNQNGARSTPAASQVCPPCMTLSCCIQSPLLGSAQHVGHACKVDEQSGGMAKVGTLEECGLCIEGDCLALQPQDALEGAGESEMVQAPAPARPRPARPRSRYYGSSESSSGEEEEEEEESEQEDEVCAMPLFGYTSAGLSC